MAKKAKVSPSKSKATAKTVNGYIRSLKKDQAEIVSTLRDLVRGAAPKAIESIKWSQPVYEDNGPICYIKAYKDHVNFGFWRGGELDDPKEILEGSGDRMKHVRITSVSEIKKGAYRDMIRSSVKLNRSLGDPTKRP